MNGTPAIFLWVLCSTAVWLGFTACSQKLLPGTGTAITKLIYSTTGGRAGNAERLEVSADSLYYGQARRGEEKRISQKTTEAFWNRLTATINLQQFKRVRSDPGHALYDGIDTTITLVYNGEEHTLINGGEDGENYQKIAPFTNLLQAKLAELAGEIKW